jgi:hypothetical protein
MPTRGWITLGLLWMLAAPAGAAAVKRQVVALPARATIAEDFNRCVARATWPEPACCAAAARSCAAECERAHASCAGDHAEEHTCRSACAEAAAWCERGVGPR